MKKIFLLLFVAVFTVSCVDKSNELPEDFPDSGWIELASAPTEVSASMGTLGIPFRLPIGNNEKGQTITYNVKLINGGPVANLPLGDLTYTLVSGEKSSELPVVLINDGSNYELEITLVKTSNSEYTIGLQGDTKKVAHRVKVCGFISADWIGVYAVREGFTAGPNAPFGLSDFFGESYQVELALDPNDSSGTAFIITNSAGFDAYFDNGGVSIAFDTCGQSVSFPAGDPRLGLFRALTIDASNFNPVTGKITVSGALSIFGPYEFVLTKM